MRDSWDNMFEEVPASFEARMKETLSALEEKPKIRRFRFGTGALAAAVLLVAVLGGTALATDFFGLKSLTVTDPNASPAAVSATEEPAGGSTVIGKTISLNIEKGKFHIFDSQTEERLNP